jgi:rod shape-determining protein MreC
MRHDSRGSRTLLVMLVITAFLLVTVDLQGGENSPLRSWRAFSGEVLGPLQRGATAVISPVVSLADSVRGLRGSEARIAELEQENAALRLQLRTDELARARVEEYDAVLRLAGLGQYRVVPAQVVGMGAAQGFARTVTIDAGSIDGVRPDMTVVNGDGLVGRVKFVTSSTATVVLATDPTSQVGVRMEGSRQAGLLTGQGDGPLQLELFDPQVPLGPGDRMVTFGSRGGSPFVPGVPIGEVIEVASTPGARTKTATVAPYVDYTSVDVVGVVVEAPREDPRDAVLPPRPDATPQSRDPAQP